jgi:putative cell wall-binding protein/Tol biopolymer transport system component
MARQRARRSSIAIAAVVLTTTALAAAPAVAQPPVQLPDAMPGDRVLLARSGPEGTVLHTVALDGSDRVELTAGHADSGAAWSPDGRHVAFHRGDVDGGGLWVVPAEGGDARRLADGGHGAAWSPDGTRIVHSPSTEATPVDLAITDLAGVTTTVPGSAGGIDPAWSPDGIQVAYVDPTRDHALIISHIDGLDRTVTPGPAADPVWSPTSDQVAFLERDGDDGGRLVVIDGAASASVTLTVPLARIQQPAYAPDGSRIAVAAAEAAGDDLDIWTVDVADGGRQRLTDDPADDLNPSWAAASDVIAFTRAVDLSAGDAPRDVHVVPADGGAAHAITDDGVDHAVAVAPGRTIRLAGHDRIITALALSRTYPQAEAAVVVRADAYPDALAAAPLAATLGGPILLTGGDRLDPAVAAELARLGVRSVHLLGGHVALSPAIEADLAAAGIDDVTRLAGSDRFGTAARVLDELDVLGQPIDRIFVVEGQHADAARGWPDALSAAGAAAHTRDPILLVTVDRVPAETASALQAHAGARATIVGGPAAVSEAVARQVEAAVGSLERIPGADRYDTSARAADLAVAEGADPGHPWLVTGRDWPDALVAAPAAARDGGVLLLVDGRDAAGGALARAWLIGRDVRRAVVVGGAGSITPPARAALEAAAAGR